MPRATAISSESVQWDTPYWTALESLLGTELCGSFMWMEERELASGCRVHAYKHRWTRRYIHLAADARHAFGYVGDHRFVEMDLEWAVDEAFIGWETANPSPEQVEALAAAVERARRWADA